MNTTHLREQARRLYNNPEAPVHINRYNQRKWVRSVLLLGEKWLLVKKTERKDSPS